MANLERKIDYDRGVIIMTEPGTGMDVFMYVDSPGNFLTAHNIAVPEEIAAKAGYDTVKLGKERLRRERIKKASDIIDAEFADDSTTEEQVVQEHEGFKLVTIGLGRFNVKDVDDNVLNATPLAEETASKLFKAMSGFEPKKAKDAK